MNKQQLRQEIKKRKQCYSKVQLMNMSESLTNQVLQQIGEAKTILCYHSLPDEVNTTQLIENLKGKTILLPRVIDKQNMEIRMYTGEKDMQQGAFGILEPVGNLFTNYNTIDVVIVPGMAFDLNGHRLGRGKGYYDRFLPHVPQAKKIGICFPFQLVDTVPFESTDISMDLVIY